MTKRATWLFGALAFVALWVIGMIIVIPNLEDSLTDDANERIAETGASVEFNGRDGYLSAPADADVDELIELAAAAPGARDVEFETELAALGTTDSTNSDDEATEPEPEPTTTTTTEPPPPIPAMLGIVFDGVGFSGEGILGNGGATLAGEAGGAGVDTETETDLTADQAAQLEALIALFGTDLVDGSLVLEDGRISVSGTAADAEAAARIDALVAGMDGVDANVAVAATETEEAQEELESALGTEVLDGLTGIQFDSGTANVRAESEAVIDELADILGRFPEAAVEIGGHTDSSGGEAANQALSEARANAVVAALIDRGIDAERLTAVGYGESTPIADNETPEGRQENRRVEFTILEDN